MIFFYSNHFSLIIFHHSDWLGFELFGLRVQVSSQLAQFTLTCKGYDKHHCPYKPQTGNGGGMWMTSCSEEIGWEFGRFWKKMQLRLDHGVRIRPGSRARDTQPIRDVSDELAMEYKRWLKIWEEEVLSLSISLSVYLSTNNKLWALFENKIRKCFVCSLKS